MSFLDVENATYEDIMDEIEKTIQIAYWRKVLIFIGSGIGLIGAITFELTQGRINTITLVALTVVIISLLNQFYSARILNAQDKKFEELEQRIRALEKNNQADS